MGWISPQQLYDDPKLWLDIPHQFHESLMKLMAKLFEDWPTVFDAAEIHCFACEDRESIPLSDGSMITGYINQPERLLHIAKGGESE